MRVFFKKKVNLTIILVIFVMFVMIVTFLLIGGSAVLLQYMDIISLPNGNKGNPLLLLFVLFGFCIILGTALTAFLSRKTLNPIRKVIDATHKVANGDFSINLDLKGIGELEELSYSFNKMTQELSTIETLRSDFINNFSHEFKTPIVSVRGFAKLLKKNNLPEERRQEYLDIIITESERLAALSTNVLTLSKYENLEIIVDKSPFRLDEQLRKTIILMEPRWSSKEITLNVELDKIIYIGNEDLTQQIWINLIDNAINFSYQGGLINISLTNKNEEIHFVIQDDGPGMDIQTKSRIFDRFFQEDTSRSKVGNGLGLPLVKRITKLCGGDITVQSELGEGSIFTVIFPTSG